MKTYVLDLMNEKEEFEKINQFLDSVPKGEEAQIYVDSYGGATHYFLMLSDRIRRMYDEGTKVTLRVVTAGSMALRLAWELKDLVSLERNAEGIAHAEAFKTNLFLYEEKYRLRSSDHCERSRIDESEIWIPPFLTESELSKFTDGMDVFLGKERMKEIFFVK